MHEVPTAYLHVGTHKTGTTSIQRFLTANAALLRREFDVFVPTVGRPHGADGHHNVAWELSEDRRFDPSFGGIADLAREMLGCGAKNVCVSSEDFEYLHARPDRLGTIARAFNAVGYRTRVVLFLRERTSYARSLYAELRKHGVAGSEVEFYARIASLGEFRCSNGWVFQFERERLVRPFELVFGRRNVIVGTYLSTLPDRALLREFVGTIVGASRERFDGFVIPPRLNARIDDSKSLATGA